MMSVDATGLSIKDRKEIFFYHLLHFKHIEFCYAVPRMAALQILTTNEGTKVYTDGGTGAGADLAVFQPTIPEGFFMVGHFGQPNYQGMNGTVPLIKPLDPTAVAPPASYQNMWSDQGSGGGTDVTFWRVVPPPGYVALGDIVNVGYNPPPASIKDIYRCVRADLVEQGRFDRPVWNDGGSGASRDGSMWYVQATTQGVTGYFKVQSGYGIPDAVYAQCLLTIPK